jgi:large subunit ribosomal protein L12
MEYVYAALLINDAGKEVNEKSLLEVVKAAGFAPDEARAKAMIASLKDVNIKEVIKNAQSMQVAAAAPAAAAHPEGDKKPKKEEKDSAAAEAEAASGLAGLFG